MGVDNNTRLTEPFHSIAILKENKYKKVVLHEDAAGVQFVAKSFRGHEAKYSVINAQYAYEALLFFFETFSGIAHVPKALGLDLETHTVHIEFLPDLPKAKVLTQTTLYLAEPFFRRCYEIDTDHELLRPIEQSLLFNEKMEQWVARGKPMCLGLKGDLWQNLCLTNAGLIIADIDSAGMEPLGMSELVIHAEIHAELSARNLMNKALRQPPTPVCFSLLSPEDCHELLELALDYVTIRMYRLPAWLRNAKLRHIRSVISSLIKQA